MSIETLVGEFMGRLEEEELSSAAIVLVTEAQEDGTCMYRGITGNRYEVIGMLEQEKKQLLVEGVVNAKS